MSCIGVIDGDIVLMVYMCFVFQAEDGIRDLVRSRGLGDVYKRQDLGGRWINAGSLVSQTEVSARCTSR